MLPRILGAIATLSILALAQTPSTPRFEEASIKLSSSGSNGRNTISWSPQGITMKNMSLRNLIQFADQGRAFQIKGGPAWIDSGLYDLGAKPEPAPVAVNQESTEKAMAEMAQMLQAFLVEKFKLKLHRETNELPVYALTLAKGGPRLRRTAEHCTTFEWHRNDPPPNQMPFGNCGALITGPNVRLNHTLDAVGMSIAPAPGTETAPANSRSDLTSFLSQWGGLDYGVIDKTGLQGLFDIHLEWSRGTPTDPPSWDNPSIFSAVEEQLGLKLELTQGPVEVLVIDHVEKPTS
jgi:uncharacterized protein (TIGR03435 family)